MLDQTPSAAVPSLDDLADAPTGPGVPVRSGLITGHLVQEAAETRLVAPICFDGHIVVEEGQWTLPDAATDTDIADALEEIYLAHFDAWAARVSAARARAAPQGRAPVPVRPHQPDPVLWAGR